MPKKSRLTKEEKAIVKYAKDEIKREKANGKIIPRFSKDYTTIDKYITAKVKNGTFNPQSSTGKRVMRTALQHPTFFTLVDATGHGKPTGTIFIAFDENGRLPEGIKLKNRAEESKYAKYLNGVRKYTEKDDISYLNPFQSKKNAYVIDNNGNKHYLVTDEDTLKALADFNELPSGQSIYKS